MDFNQKNTLLNQLVELLELPDYAYEKARDRYEDLGEWLGRDTSNCCINDPHIFPHGSFRLGTAIRPLVETEKYDLDLSCSLRNGISGLTHSQKELKELIGKELELYRIAKNIKAPKEEKHRCWRLEYADTLSFHMDVVPCIPESLSRQQVLFESISNYGLNRQLAYDISLLAISITDNRHQHYNIIRSSGWQISNPEGYARWFESRMSPRIKDGIVLKAAQVDEIPLFKKKTVLQRAVQLLKRHHDKMFADDFDVKPISVIITTIAGNSYSGEVSLEETLNVALKGLNNFANSGCTVLPNPVNPEENFADRWIMPEYAHLQLQWNFQQWVVQATADFDFIRSTNNIQMILDSVNQKLSVKPKADQLTKALRLSSFPPPYIITPKNITSVQTKPWCSNK